MGQGVNSDEPTSSNIVCSVAADLEKHRAAPLQRRMLIGKAAVPLIEAIPRLDRITHGLGMSVPVRALLYGVNQQGPDDITKIVRLTARSSDQVFI
jgi:hypothetical protein